MIVRSRRGESYQLVELIEIAFGLVGLDWREYMVSDKRLVEKISKKVPISIIVAEK